MRLVLNTGGFCKSRNASGVCCCFLHKLWEVEETAEGRGGGCPADSAGHPHGSGRGGQASGRARRLGDAGRTVEGGRESDPGPTGLGLNRGPTDDQLGGFGQITGPF